MAGEPTRVLVRRFAPGVGLLAVAVVVLAAGHGTVARVVALAVAGAGGVWLVSAAFFTVGRSEDLDRERRPRG